MHRSRHVFRAGFLKGLVKDWSTGPVLSPQQITRSSRAPDTSRRPQHAIHTSNIHTRAARSISPRTVKGRARGIAPGLRCRNLPSLPSRTTRAGHTPPTGQAPTSPSPASPSGHPMEIRRAGCLNLNLASPGKCRPSGTTLAWPYYGQMQSFALPARSLTQQANS